MLQSDRARCVKNFFSLLLRLLVSCLQSLVSLRGGGSSHARMFYGRRRRDDYYITICDAITLLSRRVCIRYHTEIKMVCAFQSKQRYRVDQLGTAHHVCVIVVVVVRLNTYVYRNTFFGVTNDLMIMILSISITTFSVVSVFCVHDDDDDNPRHI